MRHKPHDDEGTSGDADSDADDPAPADPAPDRDEPAPADDGDRPERPAEDDADEQPVSGGAVSAGGAPVTPTAQEPVADARDELAPTMCRVRPRAGRLGPGCETPRQ